MADDNVKRLRLLWTEPFDAVALYETINATTAEIVRMQAEIVRLRAELRTERAEVERLRAEREDIDAIHYPVPSGKHDEVCNHCIGFWPCTTHLLLHPEEARRG